MTRHITTYLLATVCALAATSCISDDLEPCPALHVTLGVKDKNFKNVDRVPEETRRPEDLAFAAYVPTLYYEVRDALTGDVVEAETVAPSATEPLTRLDFCPCLPHGRYVLNVYGALGPEEKPHADGTIHLDHYSDTYLASDTLLYDVLHNGQRLDMERAKDELIIDIDGLPHGHYTVSTTISSLDEEVNPAIEDRATRFRYTGRTADSRRMEYTGEPMKLLLPPTNEGAKLHVVITGERDDTPQTATITLSPKDVSLDLERNTITVVRYVYEPASGQFQIYILINGSWEHVSELDVN